MQNLNLLTPEIALCLLGLGLMLADLLLPVRRARLLYHLAWFSCLVALGLVLYAPSWAGAIPGGGALWVVDHMSQFFKAVVLICAILALMLSLPYKPLPDAQAGTFSALLLFSTAGMMFLVSATDLLLVFVALELISLSSFVLAGFERRNRKSNEGAIKYFLFGAFSSAIMVYGISLYYAAMGTTHLTAVGPASPALALAMLFILLGFGFKAAMAPMHFWVPDAYEGAPTPVTTFLSVAPKIATMGVLARVFMVLVPASGMQMTVLLALLAMLTMTVGNTIAIYQDNVKRMLAYSSVAQAGYILIGIVSGNALGLEGVLLYSAVYVAMNVGAFAVVQAVGEHEGSYGLKSFDGLSRRCLPVALVMAVFLLSLAGIPPLAGFIGKFYLFASAIDAGRAAGSGSLIFYALALVGVLNSVVSVFYYMKIVYHMFFLPPRQKEGGAPALAVGPYIYGCLAVTLAAVLFFGLWPESLIAHVKFSAQHLP